MDEAVTILDASLYRDLSSAAAAGNVAEVKHLLDLGVPPSAATRDGPVLHIAAKHGQVDVIKVLLDRGCPVDQQDHYGATALAAAIYNLAEQQDVPAREARREAIDLLLARGANARGGAHWEIFPVVVAADCGLSELETLLRSNLKPSN
ncbi:ankyrin repeat domain-containing protein [Candidatus Sumerlaeota bacterium]|nr:ankyrin repeat domain-containing protein [Candidatus Sumerlaeota bacterium]